MERNPICVGVVCNCGKRLYFRFKKQWRKGRECPRCEGWVEVMRGFEGISASFTPVGFTQSKPLNARLIAEQLPMSYILNDDSQALVDVPKRIARKVVRKALL